MANGAGMRTLSSAAVVLAILASAAFAQTGSGLELRKVTKPPARVAAGDDFVVKAKIKNTSDKRLGGKVKMHLTGGKGEYAVPRRIGRFNVAAMDPKFFRRYTVRLTVPPSLGVGRYRLQTCLKAKGQPLVCNVSRRFRVTG